MYVKGDLVAYLLHDGDKVVTHVGETVTHIQVGDKVTTNIPISQGFHVVHKNEILGVIL